MTKTQAIKRARSEIHMDRQGSGWVVSVYDDSVRSVRVSEEKDYWHARGEVSRKRAQLIEDLVADRVW
jgi:hypothetical protein